MRTRDRLAAELRKIAAIASPANAAKYEAFAARAETGEFDDYADTYVCPITQLHAELMAAGFTKFAARVSALPIRPPETQKAPLPERGLT